MPSSVLVHVRNARCEQKRNPAPSCLCLSLSDFCAEGQYDEDQGLSRLSPAQVDFAAVQRLLHVKLPVGALHQMLR